MNVRNHIGNGNGSRGRRRGQVSVWYLVLFAVALVVIGILVVRQVRRATSSPVWVARDTLAAGAKVDAGALELKRVANDSIPADAIREPSQIVGKTLSAAVEPGRPITTRDFSGGADKVWAADVIPEGRILATVRCVGVNLPTEQLRQGDRIDILGVSGSGATKLVGRDTYLMAVVKGQSSRNAGSRVSGLIAPSVFNAPRSPGVVALLLALRPEDVASIAQAEASGMNLKFALHGSQEMKTGNVLEILTAGTSGSQVDLISGAHRQKVIVNQ